MIRRPYYKNTDNPPGEIRYNKDNSMKKENPGYMINSEKKLNNKKEMTLDDYVKNILCKEQGVKKKKLTFEEWFRENSCQHLDQLVIKNKISTEDFYKLQNILEECWYSAQQNI